MTQLIAADMDGTLLDSQKRLSPDLFPLIRTLHARGIRFAAASGRQYHNLYATFSEIADQMLFIAENGAAVYDGTECLFADKLPASYFVGPIQTIRSLPGVNVVLCTHDGAFIECDDDPVFVRNAHMYYEKLDVVPDLIAHLEHQPAFKLAVFEQGKAETGCWPVLRQYEDKFAVVLSGADWVDLMNPETTAWRTIWASRLPTPWLSATTSTTSSCCVRPVLPARWRTVTPISSAWQTAPSRPTTKTGSSVPSAHISICNL